MHRDKGNRMERGTAVRLFADRPPFNGKWIKAFNNVYNEEASSRE